MNYAWYLFRFEGRINRAKFWLAGLVIVGCMIPLAALTVAVGHLFGGPKSFSFGINDIFGVLDPESYRSLSTAGLGQAVIKAVGTPLFLWMYLATAIKRLQDRNRSAWWMMPFFVFPGLFNQFADRLGDSYVVIFVGLASFVCCIWGFIELCFLKGTTGPNRFGADPLAPVDTRPRWDQQSELELMPHRAGPSPASQG